MTKILIDLATAQQALVTLENVNPSLVCEMAHHPKKDQHGIGQKCPLEIRHLETITAIKEVLAQPVQPVQEPTPWRDMVVVSLVREGINKHRARELADHFVNFTLPPPLPVQEPVSHEFQDRDGKWHPFIDHRHYLNTVADGRWPIRALYTTPPLPVQPKPLEYWNAVEGWVKIDEVREHFEAVNCGTIYKHGGEGRVPLYTAPPQRPWVGLTEDEKFEMAAAQYGWEDLLIAAEAKLKEKNNV